MAASPTHRLVIRDKENKSRTTRAGVAWINDRGWISIKLNPGVTLRSEEIEDRFYVSLYPIKEDRDNQQETRQEGQQAPPAYGGDDDLPF